MDHSILFKQFQVMFPEYAKHAKSFRPLGHSAISIDFGDWCHSRVFLYNNDNNWHFGTKLWRRRPEKTENNIVFVNRTTDFLEVTGLDGVSPKAYGLYEIETADEEGNPSTFTLTEDEEVSFGKSYYTRITL